MGKLDWKEKYYEVFKAIARGGHDIGACCECGEITVFNPDDPPKCIVCREAPVVDEPADLEGQGKLF